MIKKRTNQSIYTAAALCVFISMLPLSAQNAPAGQASAAAESAQIGSPAETAPAAETEPALFDLFSKTGPFTVSVKTDAILLGSAAAFIAGSLLLESPQTFDAADLGSKDSINAFDQALMQNYSKDLDTTGDILQYTAILMPAVLMTRPLGDWTTIGAMYFESAALAYGLKDFTKALVQRARPFMYYDDYPQSYIDDEDWNNSFPSGHTTMAFNGAVFLSYVFAQYNPESKWKIPVTAASLTLAAATGISRIAAGCHFPTDVIAGAAIGSLTGFIVPFLHQKFPAKNKQTSIITLVNGIMISIAL